MTTPNALEDIAAERRRQIEVEGWSAEHDDQHRNGEMAIAAGWYALNAHTHEMLPSERMSVDQRGHVASAAFHSIGFGWPWNMVWWKPKNYRRDLVKAAALLVAEIERLDRKAQSTNLQMGE